jgi:molybdopterin-guanine dinucleotide biosynthesis protein B
MQQQSTTRTPGTPRILGIAGFSGSGKTTLLERVIPLLCQRGLHVSVIKHAHHNFDIDRPGKDSFRHREAGAREVLIVSGHRWALMHELRDESEPSLDELVGRLSPCDLLLVEGYKFSNIPKLEIHRPVTGHPLLHPDDPNIIAVVTDSKADFPLPRLDIDAPQQVADHILNYFSLPYPEKKHP